jgi:methylenetetrahydrofolate dehydrogenase (NADP+)/methenyltetrahydrofolate cyclohydrolase
MREISGTEIAKKIIDELKSKPKPEKILAAVLVGKDHASASFLKQKEKAAKELGIDPHTKRGVAPSAQENNSPRYGVGVDFRIYKFPEDIKNDDLRQEVNKIALLKKVGGVIVQLPLPAHLNPQYILNVIPREKDVDVLGERALGAFYTGRNPVLPPSVGVVIEIIENCKLKIENLYVAVVGLGFLIGKPIATWLMGKTKEIYLLDEGSDFEILKQADLVISGVGKANLFSAENLGENAIVIDFGYNVSSGKISGDFNPSNEANKLKAITYTPTPNGTGPILVAKLFENFYKLNLN